MGADSGDERETTGGLAELAEVREGYGRWLGRQPLSANTKKAYAARAGRYLDWLAGTPTAEYGNPLGEAHARDYAARDFKSHLKTVGKAKPSSVNLSLAAIDNLYRYLGLGRPDVRREELPRSAPRALSPGDQRRFLRAVERCASARDRAIATLFFYSAPRLQELARLDGEQQNPGARRNQSRPQHSLIRWTLTSGNAWRLDELGPADVSYNE